MEQNNVQEQIIKNNDRSEKAGLHACCYAYF